MSVNYNPLWHLLIEKGMKKKDLRELTGISTNTMARKGSFYGNSRINKI